MFGMFSFVSLFAVLFFLIIFFHSYFWNFRGFVFDSTRAWGSSFECGFLSQGVSENYFSCSYFMLLVFFVLFDLEVSLLLNLPFQSFFYKNFLFYSLFIFCLFLGYLLEVESGFVRWSV